MPPIVAVSRYWLSQRKKIEAALARGESLRKIAKRYGVSHPTILRVVRGWKGASNEQRA